MNECVEELKRNVPEFKDITVTQDLIILRMARYYLDQKQ
jgi:hypothetical protein